MSSVDVVVVVDCIEQDAWAGGGGGGGNRGGGGGGSVSLERRDAMDLSRAAEKVFSFASKLETVF